MSPPNDRRVPRRQPSIDEQLKAAVEGITTTARHMEKLEEKALSGHYSDRINAAPLATEGPSVAYDHQREMNEARQWREPAKETLNKGYGSASGLKSLNGKLPEFTPPHVRVIQAEQRLVEARARLEGIVERIVGPIPLRDAAEASDPNPWGGAMGEIANSAARIRYEIDRMEDLLRALGETVP